MESVINKLFEYFDSVFFEEKVEIDRNGMMGAHYDGLNFDRYLECSIFGIDYLSINDYFENVAKVGYSETESLYEQFSGKDIDSKLLVIGAILTLVNSSTYRTEMKDNIINRSKSFLQRYGLDSEEKNGHILIAIEFKLFEGSYCDIYRYNEQFYKKQLKGVYLSEPEWIKRFKYEYENMVRLSDSPYVLKVFSYDDKNNSYLMEKCDCNIDDYLKSHPFLSDEQLTQLIREILLGMSDVHKAGIIHRDLHLGNILISNGQVALSDFGLSKDTMINHSLKSSSTPKNSHYFIDPIGLVSFTSLDKLSDIYSIGKIIDFITRNSSLNTKLSYVISKATDRRRSNRYVSFDEMIKDVDLSLNDISEQERIEKIESDIQNAVMTPDVQKFVMRLSSQEQLSSYIVKKRLLSFWRLLNDFDEVTQNTLLNSIYSNYCEATGYMGFENYDLFAAIMYNFIRNSKQIKSQKIAHDILKGCAQYRYKANDYLQEINLYFPNLET